MWVFFFLTCLAFHTSCHSEKIEEPIGNISVPNETKIARPQGGRWGIAGKVFLAPYKLINRGPQPPHTADQAAGTEVKDVIALWRTSSPACTYSTWTLTNSGEISPPQWSMQPSSFYKTGNVKLKGTRRLWIKLISEVNSDWAFKEIICRHRPMSWGAIVIWAAAFSETHLGQDSILIFSLPGQHVLAPPLVCITDTLLVYFGSWAAYELVRETYFQSFQTGSMMASFLSLPGKMDDWGLDETHHKKFRNPQERPGQEGKG